MDGEASALIWVLSPLGRDGCLLIWERLPSEDLAVLKNGGAVAEDEVNGAVDVALPVELAEGVRVEGVLVAFDAAAVEGRTVRVDSECDGLAVVWSCCVAKCNVPCYKSPA